MFGINLGVATAGTVDRCASQSNCCSDMPIGIQEPIPASDSGGHGCCSPSSNIPCNLNKSDVPDAQVFMISSVREDLQKAIGFITFVISERSLMQAFTRNIITNQFWITTDPIPIYLQNLTFICWSVLFITFIAVLKIRFHYAPALGVFAQARLASGSVLRFAALKCKNSTPTLRFSRLRQFPFFTRGGTKNASPISQNSPVQKHPAPHR